MGIIHYDNVIRYLLINELFEGNDRLKMTQRRNNQVTTNNHSVTNTNGVSGAQGQGQNSLNQGGQNNTVNNFFSP